MMRSLFLQAPSFDGYDGGAGARYQMKREVRSFWYPTWLAQPAAMVEGSKLIDAPPHGLTFKDIEPDAAPPRADRDAHLDPVVQVRRQDGGEDQSDQSDLQDRLHRREGGGRAGEEPEGDARARLRRAQRVRLHHQGGRRGAGPREREGAFPTATPKARSSTTKTAKSSTDMDQLPFVTPVYKRDLDVSRYLWRLSQASIPVVLHGTRVQIALHLLPVAADHRRPQVPSALDPARDRRGRIRAPGVPAGQGDLLRRRHADRQSAARRGAGQGARQARRRLVVQRQGQRAAQDARSPKDNGLRLLLVGYESGNQKILHNIKKGLLVDVARRFTKDCHELGIVIHGTFILGLPGETRETMQRDAGVRQARSTRTPSRCRSPRPIRARSSSTRRRRTAGSPRTSISSPTRARRSPR